MIPNFSTMPGLINDTNPKRLKVLLGVISATIKFTSIENIKRIHLAHHRIFQSNLQTTPR